MFTGLIQSMGRFVSAIPRGSGIEVRIATNAFADLALGESIAVDGCCLTVEAFDAEGFVVFATPETLRKTSLGDRQPGDGVNLERALAFGDRLGGHLVSGHVDATGHFREARALGDAWEVWIEAPPEIIRASVPKGSIAVDGISLTLVEVTADTFSLWIIPETWTRTTLSARRAGDRVNLESDLIGKYVYRWMETRQSGPGPSSLEDVWSRFRE